MPHPAFEPGFDRDPEQVDQPDHDHCAERIGGNGRIREVEADRDQHAADRAVRTEIGVNEGADPNDDGKRYRQWQQDQESGDKGAEAADHRSPSLMEFHEKQINQDDREAEMTSGLVPDRVQAPFDTIVTSRAPGLNRGNLSAKSSRQLRTGLDCSRSRRETAPPCAADTMRTAMRFGNDRDARGAVPPSA